MRPYENASWKEKHGCCTTPERHHRRTIRLREYDYQLAGAYCITICTRARTRLFGDVIDGEMHLNASGHLVLDAWMEMAIVRPGVIVDEFIVMPNHMHAIVLRTITANLLSSAP